MTTLIDVLVTVLAIIFQISAVVFSWKLIKRSTKNMPWILITFALVIMILRRCSSLVQIFFSALEPDTYSSVFEVLGLLISFLLLIGLWRSSDFIDHLDEVETGRDSAVFMRDFLAHDINSHNHSILNFLELLEIDIKSDTEHTSNLFEQLRVTVNASMLLVENVKNLERMQSSIIEPSPTRIEPLIAVAEESVQSAYRHIKLSVKQNNIEWDDMIVLGHDILSDVFLNFFMNSIKHRKPHQNEVIVELAASVIDGMVQLSFGDYGVGIPDDQKPVVFERQFGGGLGLSVVRNIISLFNGKIWVTNHPGANHTQGTVFWIQLPLAPLMKHS